MKKLFALFILLWGSLSFADDGAYYFNRGIAAYNNGNYTKAAELYKESCDMGQPAGCYNLGFLYGKGQGVNQNYKKAAKLIKESCDMGYTKGCLMLWVFI